MDIAPIRNETDYRAALKRIDKLMDAGYGSREGDELDVLVTLVESYEQKRCAIEVPDPVEFIKNAMELKGMDQSALATLLGSRSRASEILNRKRPLTLAHIRKIATAWRVPSDPLVREYEVANRK
jgi:antitoxin component HigA of HigAB toxin-antitoxin module